MWREGVVQHICRGTSSIYNADVLEKGNCIFDKPKSWENVDTCGAHGVNEKSRVMNCGELGITQASTKEEAPVICTNFGYIRPQKHNCSKKVRGLKVFHITGFFPLFEENAITNTKDEIAKFICGYQMERYTDPFLQVFVAGGDDL